MNIKYWTKVAKRLFAFLVTVLGIYLAFRLSIFYIPFLIAFIISLLVEPAVRFLKKTTPFTRKTCAIIVLIIVSRYNNFVTYCWYS